MTSPSATTQPGDPETQASTPARGTLSIRQFLTDGSLPGLCAELSGALNVTIQVRDEVGRLIVPDDGLEPWRIVEASEAGPISPTATRIPMVVGEQVVGEIIFGNEDPELAPDARERIEFALNRLASAALEVVTDVIELRHRVKELGVLHRLTSLLANHDATVENTLNTVLDAALDVLDLHAGSIVLFSEDSGGIIAADSEIDLELKASRGLSEAWVRNPEPLSKQRVFDRAVLAGEVVAVTDLQSDPRVNVPEDCERENLRGFLSAALVSHGRPIGVIRMYSSRPRTFAQSDRKIVRSIADQAATVVQQARLLEIEKRERQMQRQLRLASAVQTRMMPRRVPQMQGLQVAGRSLPSYELAGDFYDLFEVRESLGIVVGDVVGKGVAAALMMSAVRASLRAYAQDACEINEVVDRVNNAMCRDTMDNEFATLWYGLFDPGTRKLSYCSAGHEPPLLIRNPEQRPLTREDVAPLKIGGLVLGIDASQKYRKATCTLNAGDILIAYTDGLTDARNFDEHRYGLERFQQSIVEALTDSPGASPEHLVDHIMWSVKKFTGLRRQADDETVVVLKVC